MDIRRLCSSTLDTHITSVMCDGMQGTQQCGKPQQCVFYLRCLKTIQSNPDLTPRRMNVSSQNRQLVKISHLTAEPKSVSNKYLSLDATESLWLVFMQHY